ncbi:sensor histidine kinase [Leifsonia sp. SIMBA_070]|uniref:sensor histidine kinase n=1 Tax=Leifsonia sp. SIMBA_070 TaxID=3085810 RepID=UPI0039797DAC
MMRPLSSGDLSAGPLPRPPWWLSDVVVSLLIVATVFLPVPGAEFHPAGPVAMVLSLLPILILPLRRWWPLPVLGILLVLFAVVAFLGTLSPGIGIAVAVAVFQVATRRTRTVGLIAAGVAVVVMVVVVATYPVSIGNVFDPRVLQFALIVAFAAAAGDGARFHRAYIAAITERAERAERTREEEARRRVTEERLRIARDLHDAVAHQIAVISLNAGVASSSLDARPERAQEALATIRAASRSVLGEIGDLLAVLRSDEAADVGATPQPGLESLDELIGQFDRSGLRVHLRVDGDPSRVAGAVSRVGYRVVQEALTNALKHGDEGRAHILVEVDDALTITVVNPMAMAGERNAHSSGLGLVGLRERVAAVRGTVEAGLTAASWKLVARIPLPKEVR